MLIDPKQMILCAAVCALISSNALAQSSVQSVTQPANINMHATSPSAFDVFTPQDQTQYTVLEYEIWDVALKNVVLRMGESIRQRARRPVATVGTRFVSGHKSAYRLEGSRVTFSYMDEEFKRELSAYRADLVNVANRVDLVHFSRKEQLAFWYNLHNVLVIEQIALEYPVKKPSKMLIGPNSQPLHDAKLVTIKGVPLSLRDIRENIVYKNWNNPKVIYGFFYGDIGGPALQNYAITSENVDTILSMHAHEFVNSLRGFHKESRSRNISAIYMNARPYFFQNWPTDLTNHLATYATPDVLEELQQDKPFKVDPYDEMIADLLGGTMSMPSYVSRSTADIYAPIGVPPEVARMMRELSDKAVTMRRRGMLNKGGSVVIEDISTVDPDDLDTYDENEEGTKATPKPE